MQRSAEARVSGGGTLPGERRQPGGARAAGRLVPSLRAPAASLPHALPVLGSHLRLPSAPQPPVGRLSSAGSIPPPPPQTSLQAWLGLSPPGASPAEPGPLLVLGGHQEGLGAEPSHPRSGPASRERRAAHTAAYPRSDLRGVPPTRTPSELGKGDSSRRKLGCTALPGLGPGLIRPRVSLAAGLPPGARHLSRAGAGPPTSPPERNPSSSGPGAAERPAWLPGGLAAARGEPGGGRLLSWTPRRPHPVRPAAGGAWALSPAPRARPGFQRARSALVSARAA